MPKADAKNRLDAKQVLHGLNGIRDPSRVPRTVGEKNPIGMKLQNLSSRRHGGYNGDIAAAVDQLTEDSAFDAKIIGHDTKPLMGGDDVPGITYSPRPLTIAPGVWSIAGHLTDQIASDQLWTCL